MLVCEIGNAPSPPAENPVIAMVTGFFLCLKMVLYPSIYPLQVANALYEALHSGGALLFHPLRDMTVNVKGKSGGVVSKGLLYRLYIILGLESRHRIGVA